MTEIVDIRDKQIEGLRTKCTSLEAMVVSLETHVKELEEARLEEHFHFERDQFEMRAIRLKLITINEAEGCSGSNDLLDLILTRLES